MATAVVSGTSSTCKKSLTHEEQRWVVVGICLTKILAPALRKVLGNEIPKWHQILLSPPIDIDKQTSKNFEKNLPPSTIKLNYDSINNNAVHKIKSYDYAVKDPLSLGKLFMKPFMASSVTGFDHTMDLSAVLSVMCEAKPFHTSGAAVLAKKVRSDIRNEWAHCDFSYWSDPNFQTALDNIEDLLKKAGLTTVEEKIALDDIDELRNNGVHLCSGQPFDIEILTLLGGKVDELSEAVQRWNLEGTQRSTLLFGIHEIQSNLRKEMDDLHLRLERCEIQGNEMKLLQNKVTTELSRLYIEEEENIPVFSAPPRNPHFSGRTKEIQKLKLVLKVGATFNEKKVRVAAVCGLGGIGKTSLVSEYAHQMKDFYKGGVYWFSAEDDTFLEKTVNDIALKIGTFMLGSFDLSWSNTLTKISNRHDPSLIVLDCLDELNLSSNMMKFLSFPSQNNFFGHFVVLTRRNPIRFVNEISTFEEDSCFQLDCFPSEDAKQFLFSRTGATRGEDAESVAESLCEELGRLPLALEQAGACIRILDCSLASYLEQYKTERLKLLSQQPARPVSPGNESRERMAVRTTWRINFEHMKKSPNGQFAVRFMNASSFFHAQEIEKELINIGSPEVEDMLFRECVTSPLGVLQVLKLLTDFSLFAYVDARSSVSTHRLVQELVKESLNSESKTESFTDAVRMLSYAFSKCHSPNNLSDVHDSNPHLYVWSKLCMHGHYICRSIEDLLATLDSGYFDLVWSSATAKIAYECAVHMSANHKQEEAKRLLNLGYRILDWLPVAEYELIKTSFSNNSLFPRPIPLLESFQDEIKHRCMPPFVSLLPVSQKPGAEPAEAGGVDLKQKIEKLRLDGNTNYKKGSYKEALDAYSSAINLSQDCKDVFNPLLLTNRATVYIKLLQYEDALKDANDYITRCPDCWKGYARQALALDGLNEKVSAEIAAALAFYYNRAIFFDFPLFKETFLGLQGRVFICDFVDELREAIFSQEGEKGEFKILVLGVKEYVLDKPMSPWNNCILVGTRKNSYVSLKSDKTISLLSCMLVNLSFNEGSVCCMPGSVVKILNCNFTSIHEHGVAVLFGGELNVEKSNFENSRLDGLICTMPANITVVDCSFHNNGRNGLVVHGGGTLIMKSSHMYNNGENGLVISSGVTKCVAISCDFHHNDHDGIAISDSTNIMLERNYIFRNENNGLALTDCDADIRDNNFFDNGYFGIWCQSNARCNLLINRVFRNKNGGVRVGYRAAGKQFLPSVLQRNKIFDNRGPGFVSKLNDFELNGMIQDQNGDLMKSYLESPQTLQPATRHDNELYNNKESDNVGKLNFSVPYCSNCRVNCEPTRCGNCFTAAYCSTTCQRNHWSKHKNICKVLRKKSSYLITPVAVESDYEFAKIDGSKKLGPMFSPPPPRDGRRFVVKVLTGVIAPPEPEKTETTLELNFLGLFDRSLELQKQFISDDIFHLVKNFGVLCEEAYIEKKLFFHCLFENNGQLRLFTNEFPPFHNW